MEKYKKFGLLVLTLLFALPAAAGWVKNVIILPSASMVV